MKKWLNLYLYDFDSELRTGKIFFNFALNMKMKVNLI